VKVIGQCSVVNKYILICVFCALLFAPGLSVEAQQQNKIRWIGILLSGSRTPVWSEAFRQALRDLGYIEGQNIIIEYRNAEGRSDRQSKLARELVAMKVDVLIASGGNDVTGALMKATNSIPIIMTAGSNPVARGLISSLARPGGNVTGTTSIWDDLSGKRLELLKETIPTVSRIAKFIGSYFQSYRAHPILFHPIGSGWKFSRSNNRDRKRRNSKRLPCVSRVTKHCSSSNLRRQNHSTAF
jgi:ABC-type uncharacterized transport system substrate-binding protein